MSESSDPKETGSSALRDGVRWFDAHSSRRRLAELFVKGDMLTAVNEDGERRDALIKDAVISPRLGSVPRTITFADGVCVTADDNDWIDAVLSRGGKTMLSAHFWESRHTTAAGAVIAAVVMLLWGVVYAVPVASDILARRVSLSHLTAISESVYDSFVEHGILEPGELSPEQKTRAESIFATVAADYDGYPYRLRMHGFFSVNAFALPDGLIVASDSLVELLSDDELAAVFAHEIGHVEHRHGMRAVIESGGIALFLALWGGDISVLVSGAAVLLNLHYSRDSEREADCFAYDHLQKHGMPGSLVGDALVKMIDADTSHGELEEVMENEDATSRDWHAIAEALSTHPDTGSRQNLSVACDG